MAEPLVQSFEQELGDFDLYLEALECRFLLAAALVASLALVLYDHALTFGDEIKEIWNHRQNAVTILFLAVRYFTIFARAIDVIIYLYPDWTNSACETLLAARVPAICLLVTLLFVHLIMILRLYALYTLNSNVLVFLTFVLMAEMTVMTVTLFVYNVETQTESSARTSDCLMSRNGDLAKILLYWGPPLLEDTVIFALTIKKTRQYARATIGPPIGFLQVFLRDGTIYYLVIGFVHVFNLLLYVVAERCYKSIGSGFTQAMTNILVSRLVLNLRKQSYHPVNPRPESSQTAQTGITRSRITHLTSLASICAFFDIEHEVHDPNTSLIQA